GNKENCALQSFKIKNRREIFEIRLAASAFPIFYFKPQRTQRPQRQNIFVIPAKAGIQCFMHRWCQRLWTPAFAGVTGEGVNCADRALTQDIPTRLQKLRKTRLVLANR
ncbi:MAG TPA: hypothetical protein VL625_09950, partial [Patescibacteria group bacterium]|nr:hypothetical protein [Patescibacteria group bacterium]